MINWPRFTELIRSHQRFIVTTHIRPDGDALGSEMALVAVLEQLGKQVLPLNGFTPPRNLKFLDPHNKTRQVIEQVPASIVNDYEVLIVVDTSAWAQLGPMTDVIRQAGLKKAVLDHHVSEDDLGAEMFKDTTSEATGRLVIEAADQLGVKLNAEIAVPAFVALATDTGWYRFSSTTDYSYHLAQRLVAAGARPDRIYKELYENDTLGRLKLTGRTLSHTQAELDGRLIYTYIELADFDAAGAVPSDSEDLINMTLAVCGTEVAVIFVEQRTGGFKLSFRSRCDVDCAKLAQQFGGGGHKKAAGAFLPGTLAEVQAQALDAVRAVMK